MQLPSVCGWLTGKKGRDYPALRAWSRPCEAKRPAPSCGGLGSGWKICYCSRPWDGRLEFLQPVLPWQSPAACPTAELTFIWRRTAASCMCPIADRTALPSFRYRQTGHCNWCRPWVAAGRTPRNFALDPTGGWVLVGNQDSDSIAVFKRDVQSGRLALENKAFAPTPVSPLFRA